jgi:hypothetical protein
MNPFVFIVGCLRSGTTLLRRMVDAHPHLAIIHETEWVPRWFEKGIGITPDGLVTPELIDRLLEFRKFADLRIGREELESLLEGGEPLSYSSFVSGIFDLYGKAQGKRLVGEKSPGYVRYLRTLHHLWPEAKFVHLIRDGRDVCLSVMNWKKAGRTAGRYAPWAEDPISTAALWWEWHVRLGREAGASLGPGLYREARHESLVADPASECRALCAFLGIPYDGAMLRYHEGREQRSWGRSAKGRWLPPTRSLRDWRTDMPTEHVERFEAAVGELLDELGYLRTVLRPRPEALRRASEIRKTFARDISSRGQRLPEGWWG